MSNIREGGHVKHTCTRVLEPAEYPGFGHRQNPRVSNQTRTRHGFSLSGLYPPGTRALTTRGTPLYHYMHEVCLVEYVEGVKSALGTAICFRKVNQDYYSGSGSILATTTKRKVPIIKTSAS